MGICLKWIKSWKRRKFPMGVKELSYNFYNCTFFCLIRELVSFFTKCTFFDAISSKCLFVSAFKHRWFWRLISHGVIKWSRAFVWPSVSVFRVHSPTPKKESQVNSRENNQGIWQKEKKVALTLHEKRFLFSGPFFNIVIFQYKNQKKISSEKMCQ